jgi:hypothetical protein
MKSEGRKPSGREKDEAAIKLLERLREQLYSSNPSVRRQAAFHLSWMQEDGLEILREALFGDFPARTKNAAAYGLRKMRGRMRKMSMEVFEQCLHQPDSAAREVCRRALLLMGGKTEEKSLPRKPAAGKLEIKEIPPKGRRKGRVGARQPQRQKPAKNEDSS